jgi:carboxylesterase type B
MLTSRLQLPQKAGPWEGVRDAKKSADSCLQLKIAEFDLPITTSEDCLYVNVFTPAVRIELTMIQLF